MSYLCIIAAGGNSTRTGLGEYTSKAALPLRGRPLLSHQIDFARRSGVDRVLVICRPAHARLFGQILPPEDRAMTAFVMSDCGTGWAGEIERAAPHIFPDDEVLLISCDNLHDGASIRLGARPALFTYTNWSRTDASPTSGPVLARAPSAWGHPEAGQWMQRPGLCFTGDLFTGYAVVRGGPLREALRTLRPSDRGEKEFTSLLEALARFPGTEAVAYPGEYVDIADLRALADLDARLRVGGAHLQPDPIGAAILIHDGRGRVLLAERSDGRGWVPPGGIVEPGESYAAAAVRETMEEIHVNVADDHLRLLGVYPTIGSLGGASATVVFRASLHDPEWPELADRIIHKANRLSPLSDEILRAAWFTEEGARSLTIPFDLDGAVRDYFAGRELDCR